MDEFVKENYQKVCKNILGSLYLQKGNKGYPPGTVRVWNGHKYKKDTMGKWNYVGEEKEKKEDKDYLDKIEGKVKVYRVLDIPDGDLSKIDKKEIGNHWSFDEMAAQDFADNWQVLPENQVMLTANVDVKDINWEQTVAQNKYHQHEVEAFIDTTNEIDINAEQISGGEEKKIENAEVGYRVDMEDSETMGEPEGVTDKEIENFIKDLQEWAEIDVKEKQ